MSIQELYDYARVNNLLSMDVSQLIDKYNYDYMMSISTDNINITTSTNHNFDMVEYTTEDLLRLLSI